MRVTAIIALAALTISAAHAQPAPPIAGKWVTDDRTAIVLIAPCTPRTTTLCGWLNRFVVPEPAGGFLDAKNPDKALRARKLVGVAILTGLKPEGGQWTGRGYSPKEGRNFNAKVKIENGKLEMRGCVAIICRTVVWTRD
ncbi:MAG: DUF2147 domain-containing protein [Novosphingobium sp.]|nr:DUF2147 domain-containing protein [Novosphingobium sp.]